jgi:hypothetical protein
MRKTLANEIGTATVLETFTAKWFAILKVGQNDRYGVARTRL